MAALGGCDLVVLNPTGDVAAQQRDLLVISTLLMLLIIIPVMALTVFFAWKYRQSNTKATYAPEWHHSTQLELVIWAAPLMIIICLGALTWMGTHLLDPYRPLERISETEAIPLDMKPLEVDVVALDWKWLFIYPEQGIATVNELATPVDRPIHFRITSSAVMNAFYVPTLVGMIYAMPGMETQLYAVANETGESRGFSANYSGAGFSKMFFGYRALHATDFDLWVSRTKASQDALSRESYLALVKPSENVPVMRFGTIDPKLFDAILDMCVEPGKMCMSEMSAIDANGGRGLDSASSVLPITAALSRSDRGRTVFGGAPTYAVGICTPEELANALALTSAKSAARRRLGNGAQVEGAGLPVPAYTPGASPLGAASTGATPRASLSGLLRLSNS